jgi:hypothetical protein
MVYFLQDWIVNPTLNLLKRTMTYPGFEPGTFGVAVSNPTTTPFRSEVGNAIGFANKKLLKIV